LKPFFIETILEHTGDTKRLSTLQFKLKWLGYDETFNLWEPWANFREENSTPILYCKQYEANIPKKFKANYPDLFLLSNSFIFLLKRSLNFVLYNVISYFSLI
jgi:hypothetical protein